MAPGNRNHAGSDEPILKKISVARELREAWGGAMAADPRVSGLLMSLKEASRRSGRVMAQLGVVAACARCEELEGGSCCGAGIENRYSPVLLFINLLLGCELPASRRFLNSCFFLGTQGCTLAARHVLCINYLCPALRRMLEPDALALLQGTTGEEMDTIFVLHECIKQKLTA
ncbi:MAG: hypothetical protein GX443_04725 [Deltaproteobacteria bacterium]|nr:hypothetical protein [Deltaproteobacteria bacterium]